MTQQIISAEQQLIGFMHAKEGGSIKSLVSDMGLMEDEWQSIKSGGMYLPDWIKSQIEQYFIDKKEPAKLFIES